MPGAALFSQGSKVAGTRHKGVQLSGSRLVFCVTNGDDDCFSRRGLSEGC